MIKAEDLRIGDLVIVNENCSLEQGTIGKVSEVRSTPLYIGLKPISNDKCPWGVLCRNIGPIPLTPEILEKNGWERDKLVSYIYGHKAHFIEVICTPNSEWVYVTFKGETIHRIKYVHELQHILWALGNDANLKI